MRTYWIYILASHSRVLHVGVTSDLRRRVCQHRDKVYGGFTAKYRITNLVYFESTNSVRAAIGREKQIKGYRRQKKLRLIESMNPAWRDLAADWDWRRTPRAE